MGSQPFNAIVVLFWLATMSWLVVAKVLPPLRVGEPPSYAAIVNEPTNGPPVCWSIRTGDRQLGWAASKTVRRKDGITDLFNRVYMAEFPVEEILPGWISSLLKGLLTDMPRLEVNKTSTFVIDPLGHLVGFESRLRLGQIPSVIRVSGQVEGTLLKLSIQSGEIRPYKVEKYLPRDALFGDELSPQARMPGLRVGQSWTVPLYSPFRQPTSPLEILQAVVEREDKITWDGQSVNTRVIVYRSDSGSSLSGSETRGRTWVRDDGVVLQQEVTILRSQLRFVRMSEEEAKRVVAELDDDWYDPTPPMADRQLLEPTDE